MGKAVLGKNSDFDKSSALFGIVHNLLAKIPSPLWAIAKYMVWCNAKVFEEFNCFLYIKIALILKWIESPPKKRQKWIAKKNQQLWIGSIDKKKGDKKSIKKKYLDEKKTSGQPYYYCVHN